MVTIKDIAEHAEVSICTVSRYLNKNSNLKKKTREKVERAIAELGYIPNIVARSLKTNKTRNIAVVVPKINNLYYSEITSGISEVLKSYNYNLFIYEVENSDQQEDAILLTLLENMVAGVIFIALSNDMSFYNKIDVLLEHQVPVVFANRVVPYTGFPILYPDYYQAGSIAAEHLIGRGRKRIALLNKGKINMELQKNVQGFLDKAKELGVEVDIENILTTDSSYAKDPELVNKLMERKIDGVFVMNELLGAGLIKALSKRGVAVPEQISIIGFGNSLIGELVSPELTSIDLKNHATGVLSAEIILNQINNNPYKNVNILEPSIILREST